MRILITGGAGFVGYSLVQELAKSKSNEILIFDTFSYGFPANLNKKKNILQPIVGNIKNYFDVKQAIDLFKPNVVFHLAGYVSRPEDVGDFQLCAETNYTGTANILKAINHSSHKIERFVFTSCEAAHDPVSHYGISKRAAEDLVMKLSAYNGLKYTIVRFPEVYGSGIVNSRLSLINFLVDNMLQNKNICVFDPVVEKNFVNVKDVVGCLSKVLFAPESFVNLASKDRIQIKALVDKLKELTKFKGKIKYLDSALFVANSPKITNDYYVCQTDFEEELVSLINKRKKDLK